MRLSTEEVRPDTGEPDGWIHFLHGIFGAGRNWRSVAARLVEARPDWGGLLVDLRLHGDSRGAEPPHTLEACVEDHRATVAAGAPAPRVLLGHSFGGKVALEAARSAPGGLAQLWVVDVTPSAAEPEGGAVGMLEAMRRRSGPFADREEAIGALAEEGFPERVGRWMATNLEETDRGLRWGLDLDGMEALLDDFFRTDLWTVVERPPPGLEVHVVRAEASGALPEEAAARVAAAGERHGRTELHRLEGGHWLNVSNPDGMLELLQRRLPR